MAEINERALEAAKKAACDAHPLGNRIDDALWIGRAVDAAILAYESALLNPASSAAGKNMLTHSEIEPDGRTEEAHRNIDQEGGGSRRRERRDEILASSGERSERALCAEHRDTAEVNATTPRGSGPEAPAPASVCAGEPKDRIDALVDDLKSLARMVGMEFAPDPEKLTMADEKALHRKFERFRMYGEWFRLNRVIDQYVDQRKAAAKEAQREATDG